MPHRKPLFPLVSEQDLIEHVVVIGSSGSGKMSCEAATNRDLTNEAAGVEGSNDRERPQSRTSQG